MYRDYYGNIVVPRSSGGPDPSWPPHYSASPAPRRTFHNVIRRGRSAPGPSSSSSSGHSGANRTFSGWEMAGSSYSPLQAHSRTELVSTDPAVLYDEGNQHYHNFAINSNVCMCEDYLEGTNRGKKWKKRCKKCGFDRPGFDQAEDLTVVRRSVSEESINNALYNDYLRRKRLINQKPVFYDEQDEYEDIDFIARPMRSSSSRKIKPKSSRSRSPGRRSSSPVNKKSARTQSMIVNNRNQLNITKDNKEMQNISGAIRASPLRSASSVTAGFKPKMSGEQNRNVVTVNGSHGASKNSSVIYLSPDAAVLPSTDSVNTTITITTSTPASLFNQGAIRVSPFDLIKKYIQDSPNSLSDSNLSSDDQQQKSDNKSCEEESECDYGYSDEDPVNDSSGCHFVPSVGSTGSNGFKISGQKIQIYSDGSIAATDTIQAYSLSESEESDKDSEDSNYDADCSVLESPRIAIKVPDETPVKPPRRRSAEKDAARIAEDIERLQLQDQEQSKYKSSPNPDDMGTFPRSSTGRAERISVDTRNSDSSSGVRKSSADSSHSGPSRSKSFNGSRESLNLFGSVDFKNLSISKNFSSDVIREVYGSKTSLLKHLDQQREERKLRQSVELDGEEDSAARTREMLVASLLCKSTDSILTTSRKSGDKSVSGFQRCSGNI